VGGARAGRAQRDFCASFADDVALALGGIDSRRIAIFRVCTDAHEADGDPTSPTSPLRLVEDPDAVEIGLVRIVALYYRSSTLYVLPGSLTYAVPLFLKRQCDRTPR
jgi:hypothetical protein